MSSGHTSPRPHASDDALREEPQALEQAPVAGSSPPPPPAMERDPFASGETSPRRASSLQGIPTQNPPRPPPPPPRPLSDLYASPVEEEKQESSSYENAQNPNRESLHLKGLGASIGLPTTIRSPDLVPTSDVRRTRTMDTARQSPNHKHSAIDWIVPAVELKPSTVGERLQPTIDVAIIEKDKYALKAKWTGWTLNVAIGLQVLLGSLTTGLSAVATSGRSAAVQTTILGALATLVASYLARARGSNEPELSITRVKDLEQFIRECEAFKLDHGNTVGHEFDHELEGKRRRFEELLGNANGERKLSPPV